MENPNTFWVTGEADTPLELEILRIKVVQNETPISITTFIIESLLKGKIGFPDLIQFIAKYNIHKIIPSPLWGEVANNLAYYIALCMFNEYTELQFIMVCSCVQSYSAVKTAQLSKQENTPNLNYILLLQKMSIPKEEFNNCESVAKDVATTLYKAVANFRSAMVGAREWIKANKGASLFIPSNFDEYENRLKRFLEYWKELYRAVDIIPYSRKERACFNFYKIAPDNQNVITFVKSMLDNYYLTNKTTLLNL